MWTFTTVISHFAGKLAPVALVGNMLRLMIASGALAIVGYFSRGRCLPLDAPPRTWLLLSASGVFGFFVCDLCWVKSLILIGPRLTLLIQSLTPPTAALLSWILFNDVLAAHQWAAMGIILAGVAWVVFEEPEISEITEINGEPVIPGHRGLGMALAVCAAVTQAIGMVFSKMGIGQYDIMAATQIRPWRRCRAIWPWSHWRGAGPRFLPPCQPRRHGCLVHWGDFWRDDRRIVESCRLAPGPGRRRRHDHFDHARIDFAV